ncbi:MAG: DUF1501 domain-containing protein [Pirellulales bacterium]
MDESRQSKSAATPCSGPISRRDILGAGALSILGLSLPQLIEARETSGGGPPRFPTFGRAKNVIFLYLAGGPPQHETFDPKPDAPAEIRGEFKPIATNIPGIQFCELLPRIARVADKMAVVRSMATDDDIHSSSSAWVLTGHKYAGTNARTIHPGDWPYFGSIVKKLKPSESLPPLSTIWIPDWMRLNENVKPAGQTGGMLGSDWDPERIFGDPAANDYRVEGLQLTGEGLARLQSRRSLLERLDRQVGYSDRNFRSLDLFQQQAFDLLTSGKAFDAFRIDKEADKLRERYGRNSWGQSVLLARRLIEAGVRLVHVQWPRMPGDNAVDNPLWDTHAQNFDRLEDVLCPVFDVGFSALIEDLDQRGLLDETLVVAIGEFGRTPKINAKAGRDHWGAVFSFAIAGAGISGGQVIGASDKLGGHPTEDRVQPGDLTATIYHLLGIDPGQVLSARDGRALPITHGKPILKLFGSKPATAERTEPGGSPFRVPPYQDRLLAHSDFRAGVEVRSFDGLSRPKGWRAGSLGGRGLEVQIVREDSIATPNVRHVALGITAREPATKRIEQGAAAMLAQEVRSPFAGTFVLRAQLGARASSDDVFNELFRKHFTCRLLLFEFTDAAKSPRHHKVVASLEFKPVLIDPEKPSLQTVELEKTFTSSKPGQNISFGLGLGVAVVVKKTNPVTLKFPAGRLSAMLHVAWMDLKFAGKQIDENVQV